MAGKKFGRNPRRLPAIATACVAALAWSGGAIAQTAGTYYGTSSDGEPLSFIVGTDPLTGNMAVLGANVSFNAGCRSPNPAVDTTWGMGFIQDIKNKRASFSFSDTYYFYITANFVFSGSSVTGFITSRTAAFGPGNSTPTYTEYCLSPRQAFTATLSGYQSATPLPSGVAIHYPSAK